MYYDIRLLIFYFAAYTMYSAACISCMSGCAAHIMYLASVIGCIRLLIILYCIYVMYLAAHINMYPAAVLLCVWLQSAIGGSYYLPMHVFGCSYYVLKILIYDAAHTTCLTAYMTHVAAVYVATRVRLQ